MKTMFTCTVFTARTILMPHLELSCQHAESDMFNWLQSTHHMNTCGYRVWYYNTSGQSQLYSKCNVYVHIIIMIRDLNRKLTGVTDLQFYSCGVDNISPSTFTLLLRSIKGVNPQLYYILASYYKIISDQ